MNMNMKKIGIILSVLAVMGLAACGGKIYYSQPHPDAKNFHPKAIMAFPVDVGTYAEAKTSADKIVADALTEKRWFDTIVAGKNMETLLQSNGALSKMTVDYLDKLKAVNYSDPDLSRKIGETAKVDAILLVNVDYWFYTKEGEDKIVKVGFSVKLVEASTGKLMWKGANHADEKYSLIKPALADVAKKVIRQILNEMPH